MQFRPAAADDGREPTQLGVVATPFVRTLSMDKDGSARNAVCKKNPMGL